jgi:hypothetical protein
MSHYFHISSGLRGCYMPDNAYVTKFDTRKALRAFVEYESRDMIEAYGFGYSKADRAAVVAQVWREASGRDKKAWLDHVIGFGRTRSRDDRPFGLFISHATRADYLEFSESEF